MLNNALPRSGIKEGLMKKWIPVLAFSMGLLFPAFTHARSYVKPYAGVVFPPVSEAFSEAKPGSGSGDLEFGNGPTIGVKLGKWLESAPYLGYELDLNGHFVDQKRLTVKGSSTEIDARGDYAFYSATINLILRSPEGRLRPYMGGGAGYFYSELKGASFSPQFLGVAPTLPNTNDEVFGWQLLGGVEFEASPKLGLFAEYKYSRADLEYSHTDFELDYQASQLFGGITYIF